jgi:tetratricopeptide (TPR) repeat protein
MKKEKKEEEFERYPFQEDAGDTPVNFPLESEGEDETELLLDRATDWYVFSDEPENALPLVERVLSVDPFNKDAMILKESVLTALDRDQEAEAVIRQLLDTYPDCVDGYADLGSIYNYHRQEFEKAIEYYHQGLAWLPEEGSDADDDDPDVRVANMIFDGIADCLQALGRYDEAIEYLREGCRRYPNSELMAHDLQRALKDVKSSERG